MNWSFFQVWNEMIVAGEERKVVPRDHIWASELGKAEIDVYLALKGTPPSNLANKRSRRKFMAGNFWEWFLIRLMHLTGLFENSQGHLKFKYDDLLEVTGRYDLLAGGVPNFVKARESVEMFFAGDATDFGKDLKRTMLAIVDHLEQKHYGKDFKRMIFEIKSCSAYMFDYYERTGVPNSNHVLQAYHYLKSTGLDEAHIVYVCKDDCRVIEFPIFQPSSIETDYKAFIERITEAYNNDIQPALEPLIIFDDLTGKFKKNWKIEYSNYLTYLYGFETPEDYYEPAGKQVARYNRVITRAVKEERMTPNNLEVIAEVESLGFSWDKIVETAKLSKIELPEESEII